MIKRSYASLIAVTLCVLLVFPLVSPASQAYAEEIRNAPPVVELDELPEPITEAETEDASSPPESAATWTPTPLSLPEEENIMMPPEEIMPKEPDLAEVSGEPLQLLSIEDEFTATYAAEGGGYSTHFNVERIAYEAEDGELTLIDNTLEEVDPFLSPKYYENAGADYEAKFPSIITEYAGVSFEKDGNKVELIPVGGDFSRSLTKENAIRYTEVYPGIDFQYTLINDTIKEDIILNQYIESPSFTFELKTYGMNAVLEGNDVYVYEDDGDEPFYILSAPEMRDASGVSSSLITQSLYEEDGLQYVIVTPDADWLSDLSRAYPVKVDPTLTLNDERVHLQMVHTANVDGWNMDAQTYGGILVGYDNGYMSGSDPWTFMLCRAYIKLKYDFTSIPKEAKIDSAEFSLYQTHAWSGGSTNFVLSEVNADYDENSVSWNSQPMDHTYVDAKDARTTPGFLSWNVRDSVNTWVQGLKPNYGFVLKTSIENTSVQCENFVATHWLDMYGPDTKPTLVVNWSVPDPVDADIDVNNVTFDLRPVTEKTLAGMQQVHGVFADGVAKPGSLIDFRLLPDDLAGQMMSSYSYKYPDSSEWTDPGKEYANGTRYLDKLSNWQTGLYKGLEFDKAYWIGAKATYILNSPFQYGTEQYSEEFLIYQATQKDTMPSIASHYGVPLDTIMRDNRVQDSLIVEGNSIFIRKPQTQTPYNPPPLTDDQKRLIDSALMGRGLHCEYGFEPVNLNTGNFIMEQADAVIPEIEGDFSIHRTYNSVGEGYNSLFGRRWSFEYDESLSVARDGSIAYSVGDGKTLYFAPDGAGGYISPVGYFLDLKKIFDHVDVDGNDYYRYEIAEKSGAYKKFNTWGLLTDIVSATGLNTKIGYDSDFHISGITSPTGKKYVFTVDSFGRIETITQPDGGILKYEYDTAGNLVQYTDATGGVVRYVYDASGHITEAYDPNGNRFVRNTYDSEGRVTRQWDALDAQVTFAYTSDTVTTTDANGNVTKYTVDDKKRPIKIEHADGEVIIREYDAANMLVRDTDMTYTYDLNGNMITETRTDGESRTYTYDGKNQLTSVTDYDGLLTQLEYSSGGDLIKITRPDGKFEQLEYDAYHRPVKLIDIAGEESTYTYGGAVIIESTDANGNIWSFGYDPMNRQVSVMDPLGGISRTTFDKAGRITSEQAADGGATIYTLDAAGSAIGVTDARGYKTSIVLDAANRMSSATDPKGNTLSFTYDKNGNTITQTDPLGAITKYTYDSRNRMISENEPEGAILEYSYDTKGRLSTLNNERGALSKVVYDDALDLPLTVTDVNGDAVSYKYDLAGRLLSITYPDGTSEEYTYLPSGNPDMYIDTQGKKTELTYTGRDFIKQITENGVRSYSFEYDSIGRLLKSTDPLGSVTGYEVDALGRIKKQIDPLGAETVYEYDAVGRLISITDANGGKTEMTYDALGNLLTLTDAEGNTTRYTYNEIGLLVSERDAKGSITNYSYDGASNLLSIGDALGGVLAFSYNKARSPVTITDENGNLSQMGYDASGNLTEIILANGEKEEMQYDVFSRLEKQISTIGVVTDYTYDSMGRVKKSQNSIGDVLSYSYDNFGRTVKITDELGRTEENTYNEFSEIIKQKNLDGDITLTEYDLLSRPVKTIYENGAYAAAVFDKAGNLIEERTENGGIYKYEYDLLGNLISAKDPLGGNSGYTYDLIGNLTSFTNAKNEKTSYDYDELSRLISSVSARGFTTEYEYDALARVIKEILPEGGVWEYRYDPASNLKQAKNPEGSITQYVYDEIGNLIKEISPRGGETLYEYDAQGSLTKETDPIGAETIYDVLPNGNISAMTLPSGGKYEYTYDKAERISSVTSPLGLVRNFSYDNRGNLKSETDGLGRTSTYTYDVMHNLTGAVNPLGIATSFDYDESGNLKSTTEANGAVTSYVYDLLGRMTSTVDAEGYQTDIAYDAVGNLLRITLPGSRTTEFSYDKDGNPISAKDPLGNVFGMEADGEGRTIKETDPLGAMTNYAYDLAGRLTSVTDPMGSVSAFKYDADGNVSETRDNIGGRISYKYDLAGNLTQITDPLLRSTDYTYDISGNLTGIKDAAGGTKKYSYDSVGNLVSYTDQAGSIRTFSYDIAGRLKQAKSPSGDTITYDYDKLNALVAKTYTEDTSQNVMYMYSKTGERIIMNDASGTSAYEYDLLGRVKEVTNGNGKSVYYEYGENGQVSGITYADGTSVTYGYDKNDNLTHVTDENGTAVYTYDSLSRVILLTRADGSRTSYIYDGKSNITELRNVSSDGTLISSFAYTYDKLDRIITEDATDQDGDVTNRKMEYSASGELTGLSEKSPSGSIKYEYSYDRVGNRLEQKRTGTGENETIKYEYDDAGKLLSEKSTLLGETLYSYDADGNLISAAGSEKTTAYEYTVEDRLKAIREGGRLLMAVSYDGDGNRALQINFKEANMFSSYTSPEEQRRIRRAATVEEEDEIEEEDVTEKGVIRDVIGSDEEASETIGDNETPKNSNNGSWRDIFIFGFFSYIKSLFMPITISADMDKSEASIDKYWYRTAVSAGLSDVDIKNVISLDLHRSEEEAILYSVIPGAYDGYRWNSDGYELSYYVNDINRSHTEVLMEYGPSSGLKTKYTYGNERLSTSNVAVSGIPGNTSSASYIADGRGSVSSLLSKAGGVLAEYSYGPFGETMGAPGGGALIYGYNSEEYNPQANLQYLRARYYMPQVGRFSSVDTYQGSILSPLSQNAYIYVKNDPINFIDPSGHASKYAPTKAQIAAWAADDYLAATMQGASAIGKAGGSAAQQAAYVTKTLQAPGYTKLQAQIAGVSYVDTKSRSYLQDQALVLAAKVNKIYCTTAERIMSNIEHERLSQLILDMAQPWDDKDPKSLSLILNDINRRLRVATDQAEIDRLIALADTASRLSAAETPYEYRQDLVMDTLRKNALEGESNKRAVSASPSVQDLTGMALYPWFVGMTFTDWNYKYDEDWRVPYEDFNGNPNMNKIDWGDLSRPKNYTPWIYFEGEIWSADKIGNINLGYVGTTMGFSENVLKIPGVTVDHDDEPALDLGISLAKRDLELLQGNGL